MAAQQASNIAVPHTGYQSEDEDSTVEYDESQFPDVDDPVVTLPADPLLKVESWVPRDASGWEYYIPTFTGPGYDDAIEVKGDGSMERPRRGGPRDFMRPALLPTDPAASQYARRFGIFPDRKLNENSEARSMLTPVPTSVADPRLDGSDFQWGFEESFQAASFEYFTTKELADMGAFDPNQTARRPDSDGNLYHLLARDRWTQEPLVRTAFDDDDNNLSLTLWYNLNGEKRPWDVQQNDELWNALQPALQLASKVLLSEHPYWKAILSIYHMRPVPMEKDGRTELDKADPTYRPYVSVWYDIDRDKMYPAARALMDRNFDSTAATLEILNRLLKFSVARSDAGSSASTRIGGFEPHNRSIRIVINANNIWPLLVPEYSVSEKTSVSFYITKLILHELAHAARNALDYIMIFPDILDDPPWTPPPGTAFNDDIKNRIKILCSAALKLPTKEVFFQDVPQLEEGKSFETQIFGNDTAYAPAPAEGRLNDAFRPVICAISWPWKHPMVHLQNQKSVDAGLYDDYTSDGYKTFLLDPPASAYDLFTPLPVSSYAKFMQQSWWDGDFATFGHQALKIPIHSTDPSSPLKTTARISDSLADFAPLLTSVIRSRPALAFIFNYAMPRLHEHRQTSLLTYLVLLTRDAASAKVMRNRLHYEKRTWPSKLLRIRHLGEQSTESFNTAWDDFIQTMQRPLSRNTAGEVDDVVMKIRQLLVNLTELNRLLGIEVQYLQGLAAQYILKTPQARRKIHRRYMRFLQEHMVRVRDSIAYVVETIASSHEQDGRLEWKTIAAPWEARGYYMVETNPAFDDLDDDEALATNDSIDGLAAIRKFTQQACTDLLTTSRHMENVLPILGDQYIDFPIATAPTGLFSGVPVAMQMMELSKIVEKRAIYEILRLKNKGLDEIVRQWIMILNTHAGLSERLAAVGETIQRARIKAEIRAVMIVLFQAKRQEVEPTGPTLDGRHPRDLWVDSLRGQVMLMLGDNEALRAFLRRVCIEEQDEEEFDTIMRMVQQGPAPQGPASQGPAPPQNP